jgi:UDPglucose 6-dehydrogenase
VGFVGGATAEVFKEKHTLYLYDKYKSPYNSEECLRNLAKEVEAVFICVPTPMQNSGAIDYSNIHNSIEQLEKQVNLLNRNPKDILIIIRSTAVSGTTDTLSKKYPFCFAFNPEFLREKYALEDMKKTSRVVLGANDKESLDKAAQIYKSLFPNASYFLTDTKTAEMIKYAANVFLASQISIANELYGICKSVGVDYNKVKEAILLDERIARNIQVPGHDGDFGFGGKCFPKDLNALIYLARENLYRPYLLEEVWRLNEKVRKNKDWLDIKGATSENNFER